MEAQHVSSLATLHAALVRRETLDAAWRHVRARNAGPGIDRMRVADFDADAEVRLDALRSALLEGRWTPSPGLRIRIAADPERPIVLATVTDRIVQRAAAQVLTQAWDAHAADIAWAYRPGRSVVQALRVVREGLAAGHCAWARTDLRRFFERIDRALLRETMQAWEMDPDFVRLVERMISARSVGGHALRADDTGIPQGSALSPVLSNLYLAPFDRELETLDATIVRYADDLLVLAPTPAQARDTMARIQQAAEARRLSLNARKTRMGDAREGFTFLGMRFLPGGHVEPALDTAGLCTRIAARVHDDPPAARLLLEEWGAWYGPLHPELVQDAATLLAVLQQTLAADALDSARVQALAARRAWCRVPARVRKCAGPSAAPADAPPALPEERLCVLHAALADAWLQALEQGGEPSLLEDALVRELLALLALPAAEIPPALVSRLGIADDAGQPPLRSRERLRARLRAAGQTRMLAALERAAAAPPPVEQPPSERRDPAHLGDAELDAILHLWLPAEWCVEERDARGHQRFRPIPAPATPAAARRRLRAHLGGETRLGVAITPRAGHTRALVLTIGPRRLPDPGNVALPERPEHLHDEIRARTLDLRARALAWVRRAAALAREAHLPPLVELLPDGRHRLWILLDEVIATRLAHRALRRLVTRCGPPGPDLYLALQPPPEQGRRSMGLTLALPLGRCPRRGAWSHLLDDAGEPRALGVAPLGAAGRGAGSAIWSLVGQEDAAASSRSAALREDPAARVHARLRALPQVDVITSGCSILRSIVGKAARLGVLDPDEKASLHEVLGHLPEEAAVAGLAAILESVGPAKPERIRKRVRNLPALPVGCLKLHARHPGHAPARGCGACAGGEESRRGACTPMGAAAPPAQGNGEAVLPLRYPSPLMLAHGVGGYSPITRDGRYITPCTQRAASRASAEKPKKRPASPEQRHAERRPPETRSPEEAPQAQGVSECSISGRPAAPDVAGLVIIGDDTGEVGGIRSDVSKALPSPLSAVPEATDATDATGDTAQRTTFRAPAPASLCVTPSETTGTEGLLAELLGCGKRLRRAEQERAQAEAALVRHFREHGVSRLPVAWGWLVWDPDATPSFRIELG